jgi:predicted nucleotidyltransferase
VVTPQFAYIARMADGPRSRSDVLALLLSHELDLRALGIERITLFGSLARGEAGGASDVDLAIRAGPGFSSGGYDHFVRLEALRERLAALLGCEVDLVEEPAVGPRLRRIIVEEGVRAF